MAPSTTPPPLGADPGPERESSVPASAAAMARRLLAAVAAGELEVVTSADRTAVRRLEGAAEVLEAVSRQRPEGGPSARSVR